MHPYMRLMKLYLYASKLTVSGDRPCSLRQCQRGLATKEVLGSQAEQSRWLFHKIPESCKAVNKNVYPYAYSA